MAITSDSANYIALKTRIKNEVLRRKYNGTVASYGGTSYDYIDIPNINKLLIIEYFNKLNDPLKAINLNDFGASALTGDLLRDISILDAKTTILETKPMVGADTGCSSSCTGLCANACTSCTSCSGCTNKCTGCYGCSSCTSSCGSGCAGSCGSCGGCGSICGVTLSN